jgi:putative SOS response-associated peptidase YedK
VRVIHAPQGRDLLREAPTANELVQPVHERMPVILAPGDFGAWLDPRTPSAALSPLLRPYAAEEMMAVPVGRYASNPRNEGPQCLAP